MEHEPVQWDEKLNGWIVKRTPVWIVAVAPMLYNDRLTLTHVEDYPSFYVGGWCYDRGPAATLAGLVWDPDVTHAPAGWKKEAVRREPCFTFGPVAKPCQECQMGTVEV